MKLEDLRISSVRGHCLISKNLARLLKKLFGMLALGGGVINISVMESPFLFFLMKTNVGLDWHYTIIRFHLFLLHPTPLPF